MGILGTARRQATLFNYSTFNSNSLQNISDQLSQDDSDDYHLDATKHTKVEKLGNNAPSHSPENVLQNSQSVTKATGGPPPTVLIPKLIKPIPIPAKQMVVAPPAEVPEAKPKPEKMELKTRTWRDLALSINPDLPETGNICVMCEKVGAKAQCVLDCKRWFHHKCLQLMIVKKEVSETTFMCEQCLLGQQNCAMCSNLTSLNPSTFRKCAQPESNLYYRRKCEEKLQKSSYGKHLNSSEFVCPSLFCANCSTPFKETDTDIVSCIRCFVKYRST